MILNGRKSKEYILAIDTHNFPGSIAIGSNQKVLGVIGLQSKVSHTRRLAECINFLLTQLDIDPFQCRAVAVNRGPGSFTGLRIGLSFVKGFAFPMTIPIIGFDTFTLLAHTVNTDKSFIGVLVDAGRNELYYRPFECRDHILYASADHALISPQDILHADYNIVSRETALVGNGAMKYQELFKEMGFPVIMPGAAFLAETILKLAFFEKGDIFDIKSLNAIYIRKSDAELNKV